MDNRSTFLYFRRVIKTDGVTQEARWTHPLDEMGQARRREGQANPFLWFKAAAEK